MTVDSFLQITGTVVPIAFVVLGAGWKLASLITGLGSKVDSLAERVTKLEQHTYFAPRKRIRR